MTVEEFYEKIGGGYEEAMRQLRKEDRIVKYLGMFLRDDSFAKLKDGMERLDIDAAFIGAHTLKGVAANLALLRLKDISSAITEDLREGQRDVEHAKLLYPEVAACYDQVIAAIKELVEEK